MEAIELPYTKLLPTACMPTCATPKSVGLDLYSPTSVLILAHGKILMCANFGTWQHINRHRNCFPNSHGLLWMNSP